MWTRSKTTALAVFALIVSASAVAHTDGIYNPTANSVGDTQGIDSNAATAVAGCAQATTFLARNGNANASAMTTFICGLVTAGIITGNLSTTGCGTILDGLWVASDTTTHAKLNICGTNYTEVYNGVPAEATQFAANVGYTGNAANVYLNTQFNPNTATTPNQLQNSASFGVCVLTNRTTAQAKVAIGAQSASFSYLAPYESANVIDSEVNAANFPAGISTTTAQGFQAVSRTGSAGYAVYKGASSTPLGSPVSLSGPVTNDNFVFFNFGAAGTSWSDDTIFGGFVGAGITGAQYLSIQSAFHTLSAALGNTGC